MGKFKNILAPADFSIRFNHALEYAIDIAQSMGAELHIVHVVVPVIFSSEIVMSRYGLNELPNEMNAQAKIDMDNVIENLKGRDIKFKTDILHGQADQEILDYATRNHIDLICISTHGHGNFENLLFGSVTEKVLRKANCPVLSVRTDLSKV